jgi:hypothetical protein
VYSLSCLAEFHDTVPPNLHDMKKHSNGHLHQLADQNEKCVQGLEHLRSANKDARLLRAHFLILLSHQQTLLDAA